MEKKVIYQDEFKINGALEHASKIIKEDLIPLMDALKQDGIMFDGMADFQEFISTDFNDTEKENIIDKKMVLVVDSDLKKLAIKNHKVKDELRAKALNYDREKYAKFSADFLSAIQLFNLPVHAFTFNKNGCPEISEYFISTLKNEHSSILSTQEDFKIWNEIKDLCKSFNEIEKQRQLNGQDSFIAKNLNDKQLVHLKINSKQTDTRFDFFTVEPDPSGFLRERNMVI